MRRTYRRKRFQFDTLTLVHQAVAICEEYAAMGYELTLRQLYYQFVSRNLLRNKQSEYDRLGKVVNDARLAGYIDWNYLVDRTRNPHVPPSWLTPEDIIRDAAKGYALDLWSDQDYHVEVWVEKEALAGVVETACKELGVTSFACRGYVSQSEQWRAARRMLRYVKAGRAVRVIHLGDHDPSGIDMTRDNFERLTMFLHVDLLHEADMSRATFFQAMQWAQEEYGIDTDPFDVERIALNYDQVELYDLPPNPAKLSDSRAREYIREHGTSSWELDALPPDVLVSMIRDAVGPYCDAVRFEARLAQQEDDRRRLLELSERGIPS